MTASKQRPSPQRLKSARHMSDMFGLWPLCAEAACRKAGACRARRPTCFTSCLPLVPADAGAFVTALYEGKAEKLPYDEALARVPDELREGWANWHAALARITGRPSLARRAEKRAG
jgi:hypothetical protein